METNAHKVMVYQLAIEAGSLGGKVTSLAIDMSEKKNDMVMDESLEKSRDKKYCGKGLFKDI